MIGFVFYWRTYEFPTCTNYDRTTIGYPTFIHVSVRSCKIKILRYFLLVHFVRQRYVDCITYGRIAKIFVFWGGGSRRGKPLCPAWIGFCDRFCGGDSRVEAKEGTNNNTKTHSPPPLSPLLRVLLLYSSLWAPLTYRIFFWCAAHQKDLVIKRYKAIQGKAKRERDEETKRHTTTQRETKRLIRRRKDCNDDHDEDSFTIRYVRRPRRWRC